MSKLNPLKRPMEITAEYLAAQKPVKKLQTNETNNNLMAVDANKARPAPSARVVPRPGAAAPPVVVALAKLVLLRR